MIRIPTHRTRDMKHQLINERKNSRNLISRRLRWMIMTSIDSQNLPVLCCIGSIEVMRTNGKGFKSYAEHLTLYTVLHHRLFLLKNLVKRLFQDIAIEGMIHANILTAIVYP